MSKSFYTVKTRMEQNKKPLGGTLAGHPHTVACQFTRILSVPSAVTPLKKTFIYVDRLKRSVNRTK